MNSPVLKTASLKRTERQGRIETAGLIFWLESCISSILEHSATILGLIKTFPSIQTLSSSEQLTQIRKLDKELLAAFLKLSSPVALLRKEVDTLDFQKTMKLIEDLETLLHSIQELLPKLSRSARESQINNENIIQFTDIFTTSLPKLCKEIEESFKQEHKAGPKAIPDIIFSGPLARILSPLLTPRGSTFIPDAVAETYEAPILVDTSDIYKAQFFGHSHFNFLGINSAGECTQVITLLEEANIPFPDISQSLDLGFIWRCLLTDKEGTKAFHLNHYMLHSRTNDMAKSVLKFLNTSTSDGTTYLKMTSPSFPNELLKFGENLGSTFQGFKIAVLYVKSGDTDMEQVFANQPPPTSKFWSFLDCFAEKICLKDWPKSKYRGDIGRDKPDSDMHTYYTVWKGFEIMFHVAPWLNKEQNRRLIGNDICVLIWHEVDEGSFSTEILSQMGSVPQVFAVVTPYQQVVRMGFFHRKSISPFPPLSPPTNYVFDVNTCREYMLTKFVNGLDMAFKCPPLVRLRQLPRIAALADLKEKYISTTTKDGKNVYKAIEIGGLSASDRRSVTSSSGRKSMKLTGSDGKSGNSPANTPEKEQSWTRTMLQITVLDGKNITPVDSHAFYDSYCLVSMEGQHECKTPTVKKSANPHWGVTLAMPLKTQKKTGAIVTLQCMDERGGGILGSLNLPLPTCLTTKTPTWFKLGNTALQNPEIQLCFSIGTEHTN